MRELNNFRLDSPSQLLQCCIFHFNVCFVFLNANLFITILRLTGTFGLLLGIIAYIKMQQLQAYLNRMKANYFYPKHLMFYLRQMVISLAYLESFNANYSMIISSFFLLNTPLNALILIMLILNDLPGSSLRSIFMVALQQMNFLLLVSCFGALITLRLHKPTKIFFSLWVKSKRKLNWNLSAQLKLLCYLEQFHTKNLFTLFYGKAFAKITLQSFTKFIFFYVKLLIFAFKLVNQE